MAVLTAVLWAILAIKLKLTLNYVDAYTIVWFRLSFAFTFILILKMIRAPKHLLILKRPPLLGVVSSIGLGLNYFFYMKGIELTTPSNAQVLIQLAPVGLVLVGIYIFKEIPKPIQILGFALALIGFALFYRDQLDSTLVTQQSSFKLGNLWIIIAAISWVLFAALQKPLLQKYEAQELNLLLYGVASLLIIPL